MNLILDLLAGRFAVCRLSATDPAPALPGASALVSITRTAEELSIVCEEAAAPDGGAVETGFRALKIRGPLDFALTGVLARIADALARAETPIFVISTFDTDYVLVRDVHLDRAIDALRAADMTVAGRG